MSDINTAVSVMAIASPIVGWGLIYWRNSKNRVADETKFHDTFEQIKGDVGELKAKAALLSEITIIKDDISAIKTTLGNGAYHGIKQDIVDIKINCAKEMGELSKQACLNTERIDKLETPWQGQDRRKPHIG